MVRPWIQGMPWHAPSFGPQYIADQMGHADKAGATGWMVWNPGQDYTATWQGVPLSSSKNGIRRAALGDEVTLDVGAVPHRRRSVIPCA